MRKILNVSYRETDNKKLDIYLPEDNGFTTIVYFHGGGIESGKKDDFHMVEFAEEFTKNGYGFVSVGYALYTEGAHYPDYLNDVSDGVSFVYNKIKDYGGNGKIVISGQSAGAWLSLMLCFNTSFLTSRGVDPAKVEGWIIDSAQTTAHFNVIKYELGEDQRKQMINEFSPFYYLNENTKFSKMLLIYYENDMPCRPEQNLLFERAIKNYDPLADVSLIKLPGGHCHGSSQKNEDGSYDYINVSLKWLKEKNI